MKSANPENEYIPLDLRISVRRDTLRLISEMAQDMGISINEVFSFLAEDSVVDLELIEELNEIEIPTKCSLEDLKNALLRKKLC
ncbi:CopG family transcriptional regulator [Prochlorococcus marinus]|uniref:CopG family transcriptional regulator n=1 Tax=Prochlorococcus marinus TaxID=1219 RepID=UPI001ADB50DC|nr:CopG family transcriptional regulator [Prochlorococcus marinus]MBO8217629.1 CopG family transcriptional regulator [Prochlorococcus marinus XMU1405]MBW3040791.1 CopG family transcriptional regulator [Prochlorococcus marinus str. MU1405]MBW3048250.1 CopG family transcriptional regulator [Prochlorococcus marinus str. MU1406]